MRRQTKEYADFFSDTILGATDIGKRGFKEFADSAIADLQRLLVKQFLAPQLSKLVEQGIGLAAGLFGAGAGVVGGIDLGGTVPTSAGLQIGGAFASGGPTLPNRAYLVGEEGPELFVPGQTGYVNSRDSMGGLYVTINIMANEVGGVIRSAGEVQNKLTRAIQQAQRNA